MSTYGKIVKQMPSGEHAGKWFVCNGLKHPDTLYLHTDGVWRKSTRHNGVFTGYFDSEPEARNAMKTH